MLESGLGERQAVRQVAEYCGRAPWTGVMAQCGPCEQVTVLSAILDGVCSSCWNLEPTGLTNSTAIWEGESWMFAEKARRPFHCDGLPAILEPS